MNEEMEKSVRDLYTIKHDIIKIIMKAETENKIPDIELENFIYFVNIMLKPNKSKNGLDGRITGLYNLVKDYYYQNFKKVNEIYTKTK